ncbi:MAG: protein kinase [Woeseiaceae bacterium]|nr:protein kinase [Woeseiaceae bacterium]
MTTSSATLVVVPGKLSGYMKAETTNFGSPFDDQLDSIDELSAGGDKFGTTTVIPNDLAPAATADSRVQVGSLLRDRFLLKEKVSGGSMGVVYKALDRRLAEADADEPWVAIKVLSPQLADNAQALRALQQEAAKGRCLLHPNIVRFLDLDRDDDLYFIVLEWMDGRTLASILDSTDTRTIDTQVAFRIVTQIGNALDYAHRCGIVHADVKPANIMILPDGNAKLFDFGIARVQQSQNERDFDPATLGALTPAYSSMQVLTGDDPVPADDVFSLACLLYRLVAGHRVFGPRNAAEASSQGMQPQRPQGINDGQWSALKKALSYSRVTRHASIREFTDALQADLSKARPSEDDASVTIPVLADELDAPAAPAAPAAQAAPAAAAAAVAPVAPVVPVMPVIPEARKMPEARKSGGIGRWLVALLLIVAVAAGALYRYGMLDSVLNPVLEAVSRYSNSPAVRELPPQPAAIITETTIATEEAAESPVEFAVIDPALAPMNDTTATEVASATVAAAPEPIIDFSLLPPADIEVPFTMGRKAADSVNIALREDSSPVIVDFVRNTNLGMPLVLKLDEVGFSGNRSPWGTRQYSLSDSGVLRFPAGQARSRVTLTMASDPLREADQLSTLRLREQDSAESELAVIYVTLEDDDQRAFESRLPPNTIGFAASQASIRESAPAVQIDIMRFNPDNARAVIAYTVHDVTATEGEDYFAPANSTITFGPGQRSARLLIPLVQDSLVEGDEAFVIELSAPVEETADDVYHRIVVMIRDDEPQYR